MRLLPSQIFYSQDSIASKFNKTSGHSHKRIGETLDDICENRCAITSLPTIQVKNIDGKWVSADNRRLWVLRHLELLGLCSEIEVYLTNRIPPCKLNSSNGGTTVRVRGEGPGGQWYIKAENMALGRTALSNIDCEQQLTRPEIPTQCSSGMKRNEEVRYRYADNQVIDYCTRQAPLKLSSYSEQMNCKQNMSSIEVKESSHDIQYQVYPEHTKHSNIQPSRRQTAAYELRQRQILVQMRKNNEEFENSYTVTFNQERLKKLSELKKGNNGWVGFSVLDQKATSKARQSTNSLQTRSALDSSSQNTLIRDTNSSIHKVIAENKPANEAFSMRPTSVTNDEATIEDKVFQNKDLTSVVSNQESREVWSSSFDDQLLMKESNRTRIRLPTKDVPTSDVKVMSWLLQKSLRHA